MSYNGNIIETSIIEGNQVIPNDGSLTRLNIPRQKKYTLDLTITIITYRLTYSFKRLPDDEFSRLVEYSGH